MPADPDADTRPPRELADHDSRFATLAGIDVHHKLTGEPDAPAVVLLHHHHGNVATWRHVLADLGADHRAIAFDRPGFGLTERLPRARWDGSNPYTRAASAKLTVELLDHLGIEQAILVGSSAGGTIALETCALAPERVRGLVLVSPAITGDVGPPRAIRPMLRTPQLRRLGPRIVRRLAGEVTLERVGRSWHDPSRATADDVDAYARPLQVDGWDLGYWELLGAEAPPNLAGLLPTIAAPTLVVSGASDRVVSPQLSRRTAAAIPGARYAEIPNCGHTPQEECPQHLTAVIRDFLATA